MSSGLIVEDIKKVAPEMDVEVECECFASLRYRYYDYGKVDIVMLAPQVKSQEKDIRAYMDEKGHKDIPIMLIPMRDYGLVHGKPILEQALKLLKED